MLHQLQQEISTGYRIFSYYSLLSKESQSCGPLSNLAPSMPLLCSCSQVVQQAYVYMIELSSLPKTKNIHHFLRIIPSLCCPQAVPTHCLRQSSKLFRGEYQPLHCMDDQMIKLVSLPSLFHLQRHSQGMTGSIDGLRSEIVS